MTRPGRRSLTRPKHFRRVPVTGARRGWARHDRPRRLPHRHAAIDTGDTAWLLAASALVLLMAPGPRALLRRHGPLQERAEHDDDDLRRRSRSITVLWVLVGYSLAFGDDVGAGLLGDPRQYAGLGQLMSPDSNGGSTVPLILFAVFQGLFCVITGALVSGAIADRARFGAWIVFVVGLDAAGLRPGRALGLRLRPRRPHRRLAGQPGRPGRLRRRHGRAHQRRCLRRWRSRWSSAAGSASARTR